MHAAKCDRAVESNFLHVEKKIDVNFMKTGERHVKLRIVLCGSEFVSSRATFKKDCDRGTSTTDARIALNCNAAVAGTNHKMHDIFCPHPNRNQSHRKETELLDCVVDVDGCGRGWINAKCDAIDEK